ncbi:MAG: HypC/HybG/HupF family hydrogenase formation chaperone [Candidatus Krumholzibacteriota bacterium]|nr:HypC/HybG/HupF family hydrogenase formation chaperone [Candidatus Krumholzibacteriota bacterium]
MCLAIPMKVAKIDGLRAVVVSGGIEKEIRLDLLEDVRVGEYVLIHTGYAIEKLDPEEALETIDLIKQVYQAGRSGLPEEHA